MKAARRTNKLTATAEEIFQLVSGIQPFITRLQLARVKLLTQQQYLTALLQCLARLMEKRIVTRSKAH